MAAPLKDVLEQAIEGFERVRAQLMEHPSDLDPAIGVGIGATPSCYQFAIVPGAFGLQIRRIVMLVAQDIPDLSGQLGEQQRRDLTVSDIGDREFGGQGNPVAADGHGQVQLPAVPPAVPARLAPVRLRINRGVGDEAGLPILLVPDPAVRPHGSAVARGPVALLRPRIEGPHQSAAQPPNQARQGRGL